MTPEGCVGFADGVAKVGVPNTRPFAASSTRRETLRVLVLEVTAFSMGLTPASSAGALCFTLRDEAAGSFTGIFEAVEGVVAGSGRLKALSLRVDSKTGLLGVVTAFAAGVAGVALEVDDESAEMISCTIGAVAVSQLGRASCCSTSSFELAS